MTRRKNEKQNKSDNEVVNMSLPVLSVLSDNTFCPFDKLYKIYNDGSHYIAREAVKGNPRKSRDKIVTQVDELFESLYDMVSKTLIDRNKDQTKEARIKKLSEFIIMNMQDSFPYYPNLDKYVYENVERKERNLWQREKRFRRKAYLNRWNYFVTFTYRDGTHTEESFKKKLRKCLANLHTRRGWKYMGVFERGEANGRLHFHCLLYVPAGQMIGSITKKREYSKKEGRIIETYPNSFFDRKFGKSDFKELNIAQMHQGETVEYLLKYLRKTDERIVYSRGIPTEINKTLNDSVFAAELENAYVPKWVLFDNVIDWERDIQTYKQPPKALIS